MKRRQFLRIAGLAGCSAAAHPLMSRVTFASAPGENRLVVIILRGAMDGLDAIQPWGDPALRGLRRDLSLGPQNGAIDLDGFYALHPELAPLLPLWKAGEFGAVHAVSTPYRDKRSHFDGQDLLEAGTGMDVAVSRRQGGWLNRLLQDMPSATSETAYSVGTGEMLILTGAAHSRSWSPEARLGMSPQAQLLLDHAYQDDPLFRRAAVEAAEITLSSEQRKMTMQPVESARDLAGFAAERLNGATRIAAFSLTGWDSHANQPQVIGRSMRVLSAAILGLKEGLGANWGRTAVLAMTEFGRTVRENGSGGTDHGTGGAMLMAGGAIRGGKVFGDWPGLGEGDLYAGRDLTPTRDVRAYAGWALHGLFGAEAGKLESVIFPGLELGGDPGILA